VEIDQQKFRQSTEALKRIGVVGLGYVGLPLAVEFAKHRPVIGFDIDGERIANLEQGQDHTLEVSDQEMANAEWLSLTSNPSDLADVQIFIVTVPTPINAHRQPDLGPLLEASKAVGKVLKRGDIVIYESTVYPGATEEDCVPVLEAESGLTFNQDFFCGYSPERINPGDQHHRLPDIRKVTSGSSPEIADEIDALYGQIITAGTYQAQSIRVAEAAKVIENTQRDLNIALINELAIIFEKMGLDTHEVLEAAETKWNFLPFRPGLVGGHCIGVDPYYLTHKAEALGYHPQMILAGRRINDGMSTFVAETLVKTMLKAKIQVSGSRVLILGLTFKENCPDLRNTKVIDLVKSLSEFGVEADICDPHADASLARQEYGIELVETPRAGSYQGIILAVNHQEFSALSEDQLRALGDTRAVFYDLKGGLPEGLADLRL
jgi:UDP-N-acetyl-D-galactosamine dehydrogenase